MTTEQQFADTLSSKADDFRPVGISGLLAATQKALAMNRGEVAPDARDGLHFKRVLMTHDLMAERIARDADMTQRNLLRHAARQRNLASFAPGALTPLVEGHLISNPLSSPLEEINPMDIEDQLRRVTQMGPGGIGSADRITPDMQAVHPSIFGFISPVSGPESEKAGVDVRLSTGVKMGSNGRI